MGGIVSEEKGKALTSQDFKVILPNTILEFSGSWSSSKLDGQLAGQTTGGIEISIRLGNDIYAIYSEDLPEFIEIVNDLKPGNGIHFRIRVVSAENEIRLLEAAGNLEKRSRYPVLHTDPPRSIESSRELAEAGRNAFLLTLVDSIGLANDKDEILNISCSLLSQYLKASRVYFAEFSTDGEMFTIRCEHVGFDEVSRTGSFPISNDHLGRLLRNVTSSVIKDTFSSSEIDTNYGFQLAATGIRALMTLPIIKREKVVATLVVTHAAARQWTAAEVSILEETANRSWAAIERLYAFKTKSDELEKNSEIIRQSEELARIGSWDFHFKTEEFKWSDGMYNLFGLEEGTTIQPEVYTDFAIDEDKHIASRIVGHFRKDREPFEDTLRIRVDNKNKTLKVKGAPFSENGEPTRFIGVDLDITALVESRKALEEQHERLLECQKIGRLGNFEFDVVSNRVYWSDEMYSIVGIQGGTPLTFDDVINIYLPEDAAKLRVLAGKSIDTGEGFETEVSFTKGDDQSVHHVFMACQVVKDRFGRSIKLRGIAQDITERRQAATEISHINELRALDKAKTNFFNTITHEFRTPLTLLLGPLEDVIRKSGDDLPVRHRDQLVLAQRNALRLQKMVNTLLDFSRIEAGQMDAVFQQVDIRSITKNLAGNFRSAIENAGLKFNVKCDKDAGPVYLNIPMYEKIFFNLLSNAFKFTFEGEIQVSILQNKTRIELRVADTGVGIAFNDQKRIFRHFHRIEGTRSRTHEGTGIGLSLVKELVKIHGGNISVKSDPGRGSEFIVRIPKGKDHLPADRVVETKIKNTDSSLPGYLEEIRSWVATSPGTKGKNQNVDDGQTYYVKPIVLIVDDNSDMRSYLASILETRYNVVHAENGRNALNIIHTGLIPDLVLTDVMMPEMNGYDLLSDLKGNEKLKQIPVILLTAEVSEDSRVEGLHYGADDYIVKPFSSRELMARVESRIHIARLKVESEKALTSANKELEKLVELRTVELKDKNDALHQTNLRLKSINEELTGLTFAAGHDMREPLRKLRFFVHRLMKEEESSLSKKGKDHLNKIVSFVQTMSDLISDIGMYSFYTDNPGHQTTIHLDVLLFTLHEFLKPVLEEKNTTLSVNVVPGLSGDFEQIKQLVYNLISNALKFRKPGSPLHVSVSGKVVPGKYIDHERADKQQTYYELEVRDNGIGFEQEYEKQIFQIFRKLHGRAMSPGTGIGLTIVRKIVENHKGFVTGKSTLGLGASFRCYFPITDIG
jgi:signal transduction histidine kinase